MNDNCCDKCSKVEPSEDLIWIDSEDFEPYEGEKLKDSAFKYTALCVPCYYSELEEDL